MTTNPAELILALIGGPTNVATLTHCMVRLRFTLHNDDLADLDALENLEDVAIVRYRAGQLQIGLRSGLLTTHADLLERLG